MKTQTRKRVINPDDVKEINYNSRKFIKGLKKVRENIEERRSQMGIDRDRLFCVFNI